MGYYMVEAAGQHLIYQAYPEQISTSLSGIITRSVSDGKESAGKNDHLNWLEEAHGRGGRPQTPAILEA
jgi:hypothetical protein